MTPQRTYNPDTYREYIRRHSAKYNSKHIKSNNIIGIDGEGITDNKGVHHYTLLASSTGEYVQANDLPTTHCFEFLLNLPSNALLVGYSINYDINMMLRDLPHNNLLELWEQGETRWRFYSIRWIPSKKFSITRHGQRRVVWDVFGFFQCSFVRALDQWNISDKESRDRILTMKDQRGSFTDNQAADIKEYCFEECRLLTQVVQKLLDTCNELDLKLKSYHGAGSIATAILNKHKVKDFMGLQPEPVFRAALKAYYGGRFENSKVGIVNGPIYNYDIRSAYPAEIINLPCLKHAEWKYRKHKTNPKCINGRSLYHIDYVLHSDDYQWPPFPWRSKDNSIRYPPRGKGWYWGRELKAAMKLVSDKSVINIMESWSMVRHCRHKPFEFVGELYEKRRRLKEEHSFGQIVLKLGLNSLYGKTAQSIGSGKHKPTYQSYIWAGMITSGCRAKVLDAIGKNPEAVIAVATDGIISTRKLPLRVSNKLGDWERTGPVDSIFLAQPGVYAYKIDGKPYQRTRGFGIKELSFDDLQAKFIAHGWMGIHVIPVTRFNGLGASLATKQPLSNWRRWTVRDKRISFAPNNRIPAECFTIPKERWSQPGTTCYDLISMDYGAKLVQENPELESGSYKLKSEWDNMFDEPGRISYMELMDQPELPG